jgi:hypothetical protein
MTFSDSRRRTSNGSQHFSSVDAESVRYGRERVTIEVTRGGVKLRTIVPVSKIVRIVARD